jgi:hypothetical protein
LEDIEKSLETDKNIQNEINENKKLSVVYLKGDINFKN